MAAAAVGGAPRLRATRRAARPPRAEQQQQQQRRPRAGLPRQGETANPAIRLAVSLATEALRLAGVGRGAAAAADPPRPQLAPGDTAGVLAAVRADFARQYFVTGVLSDHIYADDCLFADPTVSFRGREAWKRNLALLVPFFRAPSIRLLSLCEVERGGGEGGGAGGPARLRAEWTLRTRLALPWRPLIAVHGATDFTLNDAGNLIERHVESWDITGWEALLMLFRGAPEGGAGGGEDREAGGGGAG